MPSTLPEKSSAFKVRGTEILATDTPRQYRQKLARIALDEMYQFVALLDTGGTVLEVNRAALEGAGLKLSEVEGKPFWECFWWAVSTEIQEKLKHSILRASQGEFIRYDVEIYGRAHGKETIVIDFSLIPVKDEAGNVVFIVPEGRDITEKKAYEREVAQKNKNLQALLERIRELDEIKTQFFANVSHELRTPLQLIIGPADRLINNDAALSPEQRQESARVISRNARILLKHVNDLLDLSKFEAGKLKLALQDMDVASLIRFSASHFDVLAEERSIAFMVQAQQEAISAIDPEKIQRVMMNLLSNAFKFVPYLGQILVKLQLSKKQLVISVEDSGPGVRPELRKAIFERFRQGEGGMNRQVGGTGLGLAIAKEFVEMHQGTLEVLDSELGGACFQMTLPRWRTGQAAPIPKPESNYRLDPILVEGFIEELRTSPYGNDHNYKEKRTASIKRAKSTILIVEDNTEMNRFIAESLFDEYNIVVAFDGQQGLEKVLTANPALIVTDIMMPKMSGVEMIAEIRKRPELAGIPILLLSAKADEELKIKLLEQGAQDFIAKPFSERDLLVRVKNLLALRKTQERYHLLFESMDQGFCTIEVIFDEIKNPVDYIFLEINNAFEKHTGLNNAVGQRMRELAPAHEQHWFDIYGKVALTGKSIRFENRAEALGRWYEVYAFRVGRAEHRQVAIFFNDITARKTTEQALRQSEEELRTLANSIPQMAWITEANGDIFWCNQRWYEYTGTTLEQMSGWGWEKVHHPDHLAHVIHIWKEALSTGNPWEDTFPLRGANGEYRWFLSRAFPLRNAEGKITRWFGTNTDIEEVKDAQESLKSAHAELELRVAQRNARMNEAMAQMEEFFHTVSEDQGTPTPRH
jgi:PAS domain S-box-containing protein